MSLFWLRALPYLLALAALVGGYFYARHSGELACKAKVAAERASADRAAAQVTAGLQKRSDDDTLKLIRERNDAKDHADVLLGAYDAAAQSAFATAAGCRVPVSSRVLGGSGVPGAPPAEPAGGRLKSPAAVGDDRTDQLVSGGASCADIAYNAEYNRLEVMPELARRLSACVDLYTAGQNAVQNNVIVIQGQP